MYSMSDTLRQVKETAFERTARQVFTGSTAVILSLYHQMGLLHGEMERLIPYQSQLGT